jgi:hypothetical protein
MATLQQDLTPTDRNKQRVIINLRISDKMKIPQCQESITDFLLSISLLRAQVLNAALHIV